MTAPGPARAVGSRPGDLLAFLRVRESTWHDLVLPEETIASLRDLAAAASDGGLTAVVSGEPGVGKTFAAHVCAEQLRLDTWRVDCALLVRRHRENAAAELPALLEVGERPHAMLVFHDAEWLFERVAGDAGMRLLDAARRRRPPTVLETRHPELVPTGDAGGELRHVELPFPAEVARAELWRRLAWKAHPLLEPDVSALAALAAPGAAIERAIELALDETTGTELPTTAELTQALSRARDAGRPPPRP